MVFLMLILMDLDMNSKNNFVKIVLAEKIDCHLSIILLNKIYHYYQI